MKATIKRRIRAGRLATLLASLTAVAALALAGCGSSGDSTSGASTAASASAGTAANPPTMQISDEARACLKEKGVELPEAPAGGEAPEGEAPQGGEPPSGEAPEGGEPPEGMEPPEGGPAGGSGNEEMAKALEECGVEAPTAGQS